MTERYIGSIISPSPTEPSSNLSTATASGVWKILKLPGAGPGG